jgi:hypothetical protein
MLPIMKNKFIAGLMILSATLIVACNGDHSANGGEDTAKTKRDAPSNFDTSATTTATGDASTIDNSASGGTEIAKKDTIKTDSARH